MTIKGRNGKQNASATLLRGPRPSAPRSTVCEGGGSGADVVEVRRGRRGEGRGTRTVAELEDACREIAQVAGGCEKRGVGARGSPFPGAAGWGSRRVSLHKDHASNAPPYIDIP